MPSPCREQARSTGPPTLAGHHCAGGKEAVNSMFHSEILGFSDQPARASARASSKRIRACLQTITYLRIYICTQSRQETPFTFVMCLVSFSPVSPCSVVMSTSHLTWIFLPVWECRDQRHNQCEVWAQAPQLSFRGLDPPSSKPTSCRFRPTICSSSS